MMLHIPSMKGRTKVMPIGTLPDAPVLRVPLSQHIGVPAEAVVGTGDHVEQFQLIGRAAPGCSANVHSPVSGTVTAIETLTLAGGSKVQAVVIRNDFKNKVCSTSLTGDGATVQERVAAAGIVGMGGAQFPTALKYAPADKGRIRTLIVNGTECEPYLSADYALLSAHADEVLEGAALVCEEMKIPQVVIVIEKQNADLQTKLAPLLSKPRYAAFRVQLLDNVYPQGGELQVIRSVTGMEIPRGRLPKEFGVIVNNVATMAAVYRAVRRGRPLVSRILTVSGERAGHLGNFEVKIGTPIGHILHQLGISPVGKTIVLGGPMMGKLVDDVNVPVIKGTSGILLLNDRSVHHYHCISCGYCVDVCPMHLQPFHFDSLAHKGRYTAMADDYGLMNCIECAACAYVCPSNVPLLQSIKTGKAQIKLKSHASK